MTTLIYSTSARLVQHSKINSHNPSHQQAKEKPYDHINTFRKSNWEEFQSRWQHKHGSPPHKTTSKLQLKYRTLSYRTIRNRVEWSLTITTLKKPHPLRRIEEVEKRNKLVPHPRVMDKNPGAISQEIGVPVPQQAPQTRVPVPGR